MSLSKDSYWHKVKFSEDGSMIDGAWYLNYKAPEKHVELDGIFSIEELEHIVEHIKKISGATKTELEIQAEQVNIKEELSHLDRNNWDDVCKLVDKIVYDIIQTSKMAPYSYISDQDALEGLIKDYMIDLINPDLLDFDSKK